MLEIIKTYWPFIKYPLFCILLLTLFFIFVYKVKKKQAKRAWEEKQAEMDYQAKQTAIELYKLQQKDKLDEETEELLKKIEDL